MREISGNVTAAAGFLAAGMHCGIKQRKKDLVLIFSKNLCNAAAVFTTNRVKAAPILLNQRALAKSGMKANAIIANAGVANSCTGRLGIKNAGMMARLTARKLGVAPERVLVCSTGVIGKQLPMRTVEEGIGRIVPMLRGARTDVAEAIMTTDTKKKEIAVEFELGGKKVRMGGIAKGAGMINPDMATMFCFVTTDAAVGSKALRSALCAAVAKSFNAITVDGDMSTNDTVIVLANGMAKNRELGTGDADYGIFARALEHVCVSLAKQIVLDGEGATKFITIRVRGAKDDSDAAVIAKSVANSALFKTAMFGADPNWGRVIAAVGYAKTRKEFSAESVALAFNGKKVYDGRGGPTGTKVSLAARDIMVDIGVGDGKGKATVYTCDLSRGYVTINAEYET